MAELFREQKDEDRNRRVQRDFSTGFREEAIAPSLLFSGVKSGKLAFLVEIRYCFFMYRVILG